jgi:galactokinase
MAAIAGGGIHQPTLYVVPGRVELVGKHVDYAGGRSLTCAIEAAIHARATPHDEPVLRVRDAARGQVVTMPLSSSASAGRALWSAYVAAVARRFARDFPQARRGVALEITSDLPQSAGLSSSSALIVAIAMALIDANHMEDDDTWRAEVPDALACAEYFAAMETGAPYGPFAGDAGVGVRGGAQDPIAIVCAEAGCVSQFHYKPARLERRVVWPDAYVMAIAVSGVHSTKTGNARDAYNRLSDQMQFLQGPRKSTSEVLGLSDRLVQFHEETEVIVPGVADALRDRDFAAMGTLVDRSQDLAERVLGNQVPETVHLARSARASGAVAASAFGAGFGGAVWAMIAEDHAEAFVAAWRARYAAAFPHPAARASWLVTRPAGPARRVP